MSFYISIGILFLLGEIFVNIKNKYWNRFGKYLILFLFFFVAGLSYKIHNDYEIYESIYKNITFNNIKNITNYCNIKELGFLYLNIIFNNILNFNYFKALIYFINTILIWKGIRYFFDEKKSLLIMCFLYLYGVFYFFYLPSFRHSISVAIFIYSLKYLKEKNFKKYFLLSLIACLFHKSAIILFGIYYFFKFLKINKSFLLIFYFFNFISYYFLDFFWIKVINLLISFIGIFYPSILSKTEYFQLRSGGSPQEFLFYIIIFGISILYYNRKEEFFMKGYLLFQVFYLFEKYVPIMYRFNLFIQIFFIFYIVIILKKIKNKNLRIIFKYLLLIFFLLNFNLRFMIKKSQEGCYIPFHSSIELLYKEIPYKDTAEFIHVQNRGKDPKDFVKRKNN